MNLKNHTGLLARAIAFEARNEGRADSMAKIELSINELTLLTKVLKGKPIPKLYKTLLDNLAIKVENNLRIEVTKIKVDN